jgi:hypothetical protein
LQLFAEKEEREIQGLVMKVISLELKKLELKLKHFLEIEETLDKERIEVSSITTHLLIPHYNFI